MTDPKPTTKPDGSTGYACERGHVHDYMSVALACNLTNEGDPGTGMRTLHEVAEPGELVLSLDHGTWRHFLDGRPVETGTALRVVERRERSVKRLLVRYESPCNGRGCPVLLVYTNGEERYATRADRFEWPGTDPRK